MRKVVRVKPTKTEQAATEIWLRTGRGNAAGAALQQGTPYPSPQQQLGTRQVAKQPPVLLQPATNAALTPTHAGHSRTAPLVLAYRSTLISPPDPPRHPQSTQTFIRLSLARRMYCAQPCAAGRLAHRCARPSGRRWLPLPLLGAAALAALAATAAARTALARVSRGGQAEAERLAPRVTGARPAAAGSADRRLAPEEVSALLRPRCCGACSSGPAPAAAAVGTAGGGTRSAVCLRKNGAGEGGALEQASKLAGSLCSTSKLG